MPFCSCRVNACMQNLGSYKDTIHLVRSVQISRAEHPLKIEADGSIDAATRIFQNSLTKEKLLTRLSESGRSPSCYANLWKAKYNNSRLDFGEYKCDPGEFFCQLVVTVSASRSREAEIGRANRQTVDDQPELPVLTPPPKSDVDRMKDELDRLRSENIELKEQLLERNSA